MAKKKGPGEGGEYEIGYGKPPKDTQFKAGQQSANPNGRPKGAKSFNKLVTEVFSKKVDAKINGRLRRMSKLEAFVELTIDEALKRNPRAMAQATTLAREAFPERFAADPKGVAAPEVLAAEDEDVLDAYLERMRARDEARLDETSDGEEAADSEVSKTNEDTVEEGW
ncbi:MAG: DUF5681 domain-containing protein [Caulobacterales bacterium]